MIPCVLNKTDRGIEASAIDRVSACAEIDFGKVCLSEGEQLFRRQLNKEILFLCKSMPKLTQIDVLSFLMRYAGISFNQEINFFKNYYVPSWSIIYWLIDSCAEAKKLTDGDVKYGTRAQTMAMFLHSLDDHINDGQIRADHLSLLIRSEAWGRMNKAIARLSGGIDGGQGIAKGLIDDYYASICRPQEIGSLNGYCNLFRKQMATWLIVPVLLARKISTDHKFTRAMQKAYESFGIAWRLLDDIQDIETDRISGAHSSIYYCLSENIKRLWDQKTEETTDKSIECAEAICEFILEKGVINRIKARICRELESAAAIADGFNMKGLKNEFLIMLHPLKKAPNS